MKTLNVAAAASLLILSNQVLAANDSKDVDFMQKAAIAGSFEIKTSEVAKKHSKTPSVDDFADMMIKDHSAAAAELKALAKQKGVILPRGLDKEHQKKLAALTAEKDAAKFDEKYADLMEDSHDDAVSLFETASKDAVDPDVKAFAAKTLPTLKMHSEHAEMLDGKHAKP